MTDLNGQNDNSTKLSPKSSGRKILLGMAVIFVLPFTIAATLHLLNVHPASHSYGTLVNPPQALALSVLHDIQGKKMQPQQWLKIWSIVTVDTTGCAEPCQAQVHLLKQLQTSLGKDSKRLQRVLLAPTIKADTANALQKQYPDLVVLTGTDVETIKFSTQFNAVVGSVYLIDPLGNLMMSYPADMNPKGMQTDIKKLLKNSWAG